jgi:hypothetical protein
MLQSILQRRPLPERVYSRLHINRTAYSANVFAKLLKLEMHFMGCHIYKWIDGRLIC